MIVKFKIFENENLKRHRNPIIYTCEDFRIRKDFTFESMFVASDVIIQLPILIIKDNKTINDIDFKNLKISEEYKKYFSSDVIFLYPFKIKNIGEYKSGLIHNFLYNNSKEDLKNINSDVYIELTLKYYPIINEIINNSDTIDDVIIEYKKLIPEINKYLIFLTDTNKYNI